MSATTFEQYLAQHPSPPTLLNLRSNQLSGSIPPKIGNLINLEGLDLRSNQLSGSIPVEIGNLINLKRLFLQFNQLSGSIPVEICNLINLKRLALAENQLSGSIPPEIGNLINLEGLYLDANQLSGSIPVEIGNLINLQELHLYQNQLSGRIPESMKKLAECPVDISENYLIQEEDIPTKWKCENAFRKGIELLLQQALKDLGVNAALLFKNIPDNEIEHCMKTGEIPIGFSDSLLWTKILEKMKQLQEEYKEKEKRYESLKNEEQKIFAKLKQLEEEQAKLAKILTNTQAEKKKLENEVLPWLESKEIHFQQAIQFVQITAEKETKLTKQMDDCRLSDSEFTSNFAGDAPLSLVFNAIGLSEQSIKKLEYLDELEFLNTNIQSDCTNLEIPIGEQLELFYCQKIWNEQRVFPSRVHEQNCVVCSHSTPENIWHLIVEHDKQNVFDWNWIKTEKITGRRLIGMVASNINQIFPETHKEIKAALLYFLKLHKKA